MQCSSCQSIVFLILVVILAGRPSEGRADWVNLSGAEVAPNIAEIRIEETGVKVALEIFIADIERFSDLVPREQMPDDVRQNAAPDAERLARFAASGLNIRDDLDRSLPVELRLLEPRERVDRRGPFAGMIDVYTGRRYPAPPEDTRVLYAELFYPFEGAPPQTLTLSPPADGEGTPIATIGMIMLHRDVPVIDFRYLAGPATIDLDWDDPWYSRFENPNLTRHHRYPRMSFLYAEPYEIRHEALLRVRDALALTGMTPSGPTLSDDQARRLIDEAAAAVAARSPMTIDSTPITPDFDRGAFLRIGPQGLVLMDPGEIIDVDAAILGLIWSAATDGMPKEATVEWTLFDERADQVPGYAIDAAGPFLSPLTPDDPVLVWTNHFKKPPVPPVTEIDAYAYANVSVPALSIAVWLAALGLVVCAWRAGRKRRGIAYVGVAVAFVTAGVLVMPYGTVSLPRPAMAPAEMSDEDSVRLTAELLSNVYRAFDFRGETQVYDRLEMTVDGALLEQVYLDQRRTLRVARAGGAEARVENVTVESAVATPTPGTATDFTVRARWTILGRVGHWGHIHQRQNVYEADIAISAESGSWKIIGFDVLSQERLS